MLSMKSDRDVQEFAQAPRLTEQERMSLAAKVGPARKARGFTQAELADAAGVSRGTVGNIESGKIVPQADVLWRVLGALDARPGGGVEWSPEVEGWVRLIASLIEQIPADVRERVMLDIVVQLGAAAQRRD